LRKGGRWHGKEDDYDNQIDIHDEPLDVDFVDMGGSRSYASELLSEREVEELNCEGFGHEELEEAFVDEEGIPIMNNIEALWLDLVCKTWDDLFLEAACIATDVHSTYGGGSGSGGCEDDEPGDDEDGGEDEEDEDDS
nr:hypothetical protein [Tanacetum cinerariifolium]